MMSELKVGNLDHLGLVAGVIDELGLVALLDELFPPHRDNHITTGQVVKAIILNCLGFLSAPLYLFSQFFESKPVAHLVGEGIEAGHLNNDRIGRVLDQLRDGGVPLFLEVASGNQSDRQEFGRLMQEFHADWDVETLFVVDAAFYSIFESPPVFHQQCVVSRKQ